ncbi:hypothetical protein U9M48_011979 [Paspalum notatum var. saurae]|uniref:F-box domain-containing protein n=1 Tax=Paspalum notatum var. saurae TaxID=547442 RepID=A0AAQ3SXD4_PASNO
MDCPETERGRAAAALPDELLVEILSRVPVKSLCLSKCVSKAWRDLIADPLHRKKLPQTLEGFFFCSYRSAAGTGLAAYACTGAATAAVSLTWWLVGRPSPPVNPSFSFLAPLVESPPSIEILHSCNGLLLLRRGRIPPWDYVVCNPATEEWVAVPSSRSSSDDPPEVEDDENFSDTFLIFDPVVSSHFKLLQYLLKLRLRTYSSETGVWTGRSGERRRLEEGGGNGQRVSFDGVAPLGSAYVNGMLHFIAFLVEEGSSAGQGHRVTFSIGLHVGQSQGRLCCMGNDMEDNSAKINIWVLEDYDKEEWVMKHTVSYSHLFGISRWQLGFDYNVVAIHPDRNLVFIVVRRRRLISYNMESNEVQALCTFGHGYREMTPYVPYFSESPVLSSS